MTISSALTTPDNVILILLVIILSVAVIICVKQIQHLRKEIKSRDSSLQSFHVKAGNIAEQMAPFSTVFPWNPEGFKFLGKPIDGIQFEDDRIILVEFKTGKSKLNQNQRNIRNLVNNQAVYFEEVRLG